MNVKVVIEQSTEGKYFIYVPSLPGVLADGSTREEALAGIKTAIRSYLEPCDEDLPNNRETVREIEI